MGFTRASQHLLYSAEGDGPCRVLRTVGYMDGCAKVACGFWERVYDTHSGELTGFRVLARMPHETGGRTVCSPSGITLGELQTFFFEGSRTAGMNEIDRADRVVHGDAAEDAVERVVAKVLVWPNVRAAKGDILRVWPRGCA